MGATDQQPPATVPDLSVRLARPGEYAAAGNPVADVYGAAGYAHGTYLDLLRDAARCAAAADLLVAVDADGRVLGTVTDAIGGTPSPTSPPRTRRSFGCSPSKPAARGRGGEALVRAAIGRARARGKHRLVMSTQPEMRTAHRLYERLGFARAPERDWSPEPGLHLRVYARNLDADGIGDDPP